MKTRLHPFILALLLCPALFAQDYAIRLQRPLKVGDELNISVTAKISQSTTQTINDGKPQEEKHEVTVHFDGLEKVLAVDDNGKETKISLTVDKFTEYIAGAAATIAFGKKGTVIDCSTANKKPVFEINGKPANSPTAQALAMIVDLGHNADDEIFGAKDRKKKGDSWDINADAAKSQLEAGAARTQFVDFSGKTTLEDVTGDTMKISAHIAGKVKPPLPQGVTLDDSSFNVTYAGTFPIDATKYPAEVMQAMSMSFLGHGSGTGGKIVVKATVEQSLDRKAAPVNQQADNPKVETPSK